VCRQGVAPKGARVIVSAGGVLWLFGKKSAAWHLADAATPIKTGFKKDVIAAAAFGPGLLVVGAGGFAARWNGQVWTVDKTPAKKDLNAVAVVGDATAWAVGRAGTIVRWDGVKWAAEPSGVKIDLRAVWAASATDVWAAGDGGTVLHRDANGWSVSRTGNAKFFALSGSATNDVYAAGEIGGVLRWDGRSWVTVATGVGDDLRVIVQYSKKEVLIGGTGGLLARRDEDSDWRAQSAGEATFVSATIHRGVTVLLGEDGNLWRYAGGWRTEPAPTVDGLDASWVNGDEIVAGGGEGAMARYTGGAWQLLVKSVEKMGTISGIGWDGKAWVAVGYGGNAMTVKPGGSAKPVVRKLSAKRENGVNGMWMMPGIGFAVGGYGEISKWDGKTWSELPKLVNDELNDVYGVAPDAVWAVGDGGLILFWNGTEWVKQDSGVTDELEVVWAASKEWAIAAGHWGTVTLWSGGQWGKIEVPSSAMWRAACGRSASDVVLGGNSGEIVTWNGKRWQLEANPSGSALVGCTITAAGIMMHVQSGGLVVHAPR